MTDLLNIQDISYLLVFPTDRDAIFDLCDVLLYFISCLLFKNANYGALILYRFKKNNLVNHVIKLHSKILFHMNIEQSE